MPASATLRLRENAVDVSSAPEHSIRVVLIPDLGTAPVIAYREMLRRLVKLREGRALTDSSLDVELELAVATPDADGTENRSRAWQAQLDSIVRRHGPCGVQVRVLSWDRSRHAETQPVTGAHVG
jgi:hypothetical protein